MIGELESQPSAIHDFRRLLFWIAVSLILHALWLYALQGQIPIAATDVPNSAILYISTNPQSLGSSQTPPLIDQQPPSATSAEIEMLFDELFTSFAQP